MCECRREGFEREGNSRRHIQNEHLLSCRRRRRMERDEEEDEAVVFGMRVWRERELEEWRCTHNVEQREGE